MRRLVVNADDFGFTRDVNEGIVEAHQNGILTATTIMANGTAFSHAVELAKDNPDLDVGCHLVLVGGQSLLRPGEDLPGSVTKMMAAITAKLLQPYAELRAQVVRILETGLDPVHMDTHKHTHLFPPVLDALARLSREFQIPWVRRPFDLPMPSGADAANVVPWLVKTSSRGLQFVRKRFEMVLEQNGCQTTDHFAGFQMTGRFRAAQLAELIHHLPDGLTEFMCHPGKLGSELQAAPTRLKESRAEELEALTSPLVAKALEETGVKLVGFRELTGQRAG
jgi:predicted glycoside hydrolase/deacetylase ChbG (UPF0249 family)